MKKIEDFINSDTLKSVYYGLVQPILTTVVKFGIPLIEASLNEF